MNTITVHSAVIFLSAMKCLKVWSSMNVRIIVATKVIITTQMSFLLIIIKTLHDYLNDICINQYF